MLEIFLELCAPCACADLLIVGTKVPETLQVTDKNRDHPLQMHARRRAPPESTFGAKSSRSPQTAMTDLPLRIATFSCGILPLEVHYFGQRHSVDSNKVYFVDSNNIALCAACVGSLR
jgi:hypothetical protein